MSTNELGAFAPRHILVVDDDPMAQEILADHYRALGFTVAVASDGADALAAMNVEKPDLILCDRVMPGMSGAELLAAVRARGRDWVAPIFVFVTVLTDRRDHYAMLPLHPDGYLHKPIDFAEADATLAALLHKRAEMRAAPH